MLWKLLTARLFHHRLKSYDYSPRTSLEDERTRSRSDERLVRAPPRSGEQPASPPRNP
jgi:hypothetical protein